MTADTAAKRLWLKPRQLMAWTILISLVFYFAVIPAYRWMTAPPPLNVAAFDQVRPGMSMEEVSSLLGGPPGDYGRFDGNAMMTLEGAFGPPGSLEADWFDDDNRLEVWFDQAGTVVHVHRRAHFTRRPESISDTLRRHWNRAKSGLGL